MTLRPALLALALLLASGIAATEAHAQARNGQRGDQAVLPVYNSVSGKVEAVLLLEPTDASGARWGSGSRTLDAAFGLQAGDSLGLSCSRLAGLQSGLGGLANNCQLASFEDERSRRVSGTASLARAGGRVGIAAGGGRESLPAWLSSGARGQATAAATTQVDVNDMTLFAQKAIGSEAMVRIAGTMAKATLMTPAQASSLGLPDSWTSKSLTVGGDYGRFGASIIGQVVDTPGQPKWEGVGLGLTWRTPWSGQLTVGADNIVTRGRNPFSPAADSRDDEGTTPYVRYEQDL